MLNNKTILQSFLFILIIAIGGTLYFQSSSQITEEAQSVAAAEEIPAEKIPLQAAALTLAETAEIYVQDGYNLRLKEPQPTNCAKCFSFIFDHYGDPGAVYELTMRINKQGQAEWIEE